MIKTQKWLHGEKKTKQELRLKDIQDILESEQFGKNNISSIDVYHTYNTINLMQCIIL